VPFPGGEGDLLDWGLGGTRSQPQSWVETSLGARWFRLDLADTIEYDVTGLSDTAGQIRSMIEGWDALHVRVRSVHVIFFAGQGRGDGRTDL